MNPDRPASPVAYAGEPGAFAEDAVLAAFGDVARVSLGGFREVFEAVTAGRGRGRRGPDRERHQRHGPRELRPAARARARDRRRGRRARRGCAWRPCPGQRLDDIERVYSHIQALGQAEAFLRTRPWQLLTTYNTAGAGKAIVDRGERGAAAVLSPRAAALFGLEILADEIGDLPGNRTRFVVLGPARDEPRRCSPRPGRGVGRRSSSRSGTSPGTLLAVLRVFAEHGLNMSKLESRPSRERAWEYVFWVDLDADTPRIPGRRPR